MPQPTNSPTAVTIEHYTMFPKSPVYLQMISSKLLSPWLFPLLLASHPLFWHPQPPLFSNTHVTAVHKEKSTQFNTPPYRFQKPILLVQHVGEVAPHLSYLLQTPSSRYASNSFVDTVHRNPPWPIHASVTTCVGDQSTLGDEYSILGEGLRFPVVQSTQDGGLHIQPNSTLGDDHLTRHQRLQVHTRSSSALHEYPPFTSTSLSSIGHTVPFALDGVTHPNRSQDADQGTRNVHQDTEQEQSPYPLL